MSAVAALLETLWHSSTVPKTYCRIADDHVLDAGYAARAFEADQCYFTFSLSEMFLADARKLWQGFAPLAVAVTEFQYAGQRQSAPMVIGKDMLASIQQYLNGENVEYRNTKILGPCPYTGGSVSLFMGLFQTAANSPTTEIFGVLADIAGAFELTGLSGYLPVAKVVTTGLGRLLGLNGTHLRIGARDEFTAGAGDPSPFREGFLAYVNCSPDELALPLWTRDGALLAGRARDSAQPVTRYDHCVVRIELRSERNDYTSLPFHALWNKTRDLVWQKQEEKARGTFLELAQQVAGSPDLTGRHRLGLLKVYRANLESELETFRITTEGVAGPSATRGAGHGSISPKAALQREALNSQTAGFGKDIETALLGIAQDLPKLHQIRGKNALLTDEVLSQQMGAIAHSAADPQTLADALVVSAFAK